jgi:GT2 family glycosyltransferase
LTVDVVIVSYNSTNDLPGCIAAVRHWHHTGRVIVVDNASTDDSASVAHELADEVVVSEQNVGYGAGQNLGVSRASAPFFLALNPDARVVPDALERGLVLAEGHPEIAALQGVILRARDDAPERTHGREPGLADLVSHRLRLRQRFGEGVLRRAAPMFGLRYFSDRVPSGAVDTPFLAAVAPLIRRSAFLAVGGFDERYFLYAEDIDLSRRLRMRGWRLLSLPDTWAYHEGGASTAAEPALRDNAWWQAHRRFVEQHWTGPRRTVGLALTRRYRESSNE